MFRTIKAAKEGKPLKGILELGLREKGVDYVDDANNKSLISPAARNKAEEARRLIIAGKIKVPSK